MMNDEKCDKIMKLLDMEFKLRAGELEDRKLIRGIRGFNFRHNEREKIIDKAYILFEKIEDDELIPYISILFDYLINYQLNCAKELIDFVQSKTTSNKRQNIKEQNMIKGIDYIVDYLGGLVSRTEKATKLKEMLRDLKADPYSFLGEGVKSYTKEHLKSDLRRHFKGETDSVNDLVNSLSSEFIIKNNSKV